MYWGIVKLCSDVRELALISDYLTLWSLFSSVDSSHVPIQHTLLVELLPAKVARKFPLWMLSCLMFWQGVFVLAGPIAYLAFKFLFFWVNCFIVSFEFAFLGKWLATCLATERSKLGVDSFVVSNELMPLSEGLSTFRTMIGFQLHAILEIRVDFLLRIIETYWQGKLWLSPLHARFDTMAKHMGHQLILSIECFLTNGTYE